MEREAARLALSIVDGLMHEAPGAEAMVLETFDSLDDALTAYAHLVGFVLQTFADFAGVSVEDAVALVRQRIDSVGS